MPIEVSARHRFVRVSFVAAVVLAASQAVALDVSGRWKTRVGTGGAVSLSGEASLVQSGSALSLALSYPPANMSGTIGSTAGFVVRGSLFGCSNSAIGGGVFAEARRFVGTVGVLCGSPLPDATYQLPAVRWRVLGKPGANGGYQYQDKRQETGPVTTVVVKPGKSLKVSAKGAGLEHQLGADPSPVDVTLTLGAQRSCLQFGGLARLIPGRKLIAAGAPAPPDCP